MSERVHVTARDWILSRLSVGKRGYCSSPEVSAALKTMRDAGEIRYTDGKWWRP